jgi:hypothetical protein
VVILAISSLMRCEIGALEPTHGHAVDAARPRLVSISRTAATSTRLER